MREKQNPVEKEWAAVVKAEERFLRHAMPGADGGLGRRRSRAMCHRSWRRLCTPLFTKRLN